MVQTLSRPDTMNPSSSHFHEICGLRYHIRTWGNPNAPKLFFLHGFLDISASFQFVVDALKQQWHVIAPDWRGFGLTEWCDTGYWYPDYFRDLESILDLYEPTKPVNLVGHSMGGNIACMYAGIRPERVARLATLEGFGLADSDPEDAAFNYAKWMDNWKTKRRSRAYLNLDLLVRRLLERNPRLTPERALFLAQHMGQTLPNGSVMLRSDPKHNVNNANQYRLAEAMACWRNITAETLWMDADQGIAQWMSNHTGADIAQRKACFQRLYSATISDCGHMLIHDQPEQVAEILERFFLGDMAAAPNLALVETKLAATR